MKPLEDFLVNKQLKATAENGRLDGAITEYTESGEEMKVYL